MVEKSKERRRKKFPLHLTGWEKQKRQKFWMPPCWNFRKMDLNRLQLTALSKKPRLARGPSFTISPVKRSYFFS